MLKLVCKIERYNKDSKIVSEYKGTIFLKAINNFTSVYDNEREVLFNPDSKCNVTKFKLCSNGHYEITMIEV
jgi:hypothetical protein